MTRLIIRPGTKEDLPFILDSWLNSHAESKILSPYIPRELYFELHRPIVEGILDRAVIHMAVNEEDPDLIYGYIVFEKHPQGNIFHYVYVKRAFNGFGIATKLIESAPFQLEDSFVTHLTHMGRKVFAKHDFNYCFYFLYPVKK